MSDYKNNLKKIIVLFILLFFSNNITVSAEEEKRRHIQREDTQTEKWLAGRRSQISNIMTNFMLMGDLLIRDTTVDNVKEEILKALDI